MMLIFSLNLYNQRSNIQKFLLIVKGKQFFIVMNNYEILHFQVFFYWRWDNDFCNWRLIWKDSIINCCYCWRKCYFFQWWAAIESRITNRLNRRWNKYFIFEKQNHLCMQQNSLKFFKAHLPIVILWLNITILKISLFPICKAKFKDIL